MAIKVHHAKQDAVGFLDDFAEPTIIEADQDILAYFLANIDTGSAIPAGIQWNNILMSNDDDVAAPGQEHVDRAQEIRTFYRNRIMLQRLRGHQTSQFQNKTYQFVTSENPNRVSIDDQGIMIKLPEFYEYDLAMDQLHKDYNTEFDEVYKRMHGSLNRLASAEVYTLSFAAHTQRNTKSTKQHEYWFADSNRTLHKLAFELGNPLKQLFEKYLTDNNGTLNISANRVWAMTPGYEAFDYLEMAHWEIH